MKAKPGQQDLFRDQMSIIKKKRKKMSGVSQNFLTPSAERIELPFIMWRAELCEKLEFSQL